MNFFLSQKKIVLEELEKEIVCSISGGVPELMSILIDALGMLKNEGKTVSYDALLDAAISHDGCVSLFNSWISGITVNQKKILYDVARSFGGAGKNDISFAESKMAELADEVGRGLLHVSKENDEKKWYINAVAFEHYIISRGESFYQDTVEKMSEMT